MSVITSLPNDNFVDLSKLRAYADDMLDVVQMNRFSLDSMENLVGKEENGWLPAFSPFPAWFSRDYFLMVVESQDCI